MLGASEQKAPPTPGKKPETASKPAAGSSGGVAGLLRATPPDGVI
jgi:hypothetical protein